MARATAKAPTRSTGQDTPPQTSEVLGSEGLNSLGNEEAAMSAYATLQDLTDRFGETEIVQRTDRTNRPPTTIDTVVVDRALTDAGALVDGYVGKVYALPIALVPPVLTKATADIARYYLFGKAAEKDGEVERAYKEAVAWLKDVALGRVQLDVGGVVPEQPGGGQVHIAAPERRFTRANMRGL